MSKPARLARSAASPLGSAPNGYGDILSFQTPALHLPFTVSYKRFERPDRDAPRADALTIDDPLALSADDVLSAHDTIAEWLRAERP